MAGALEGTTVVELGARVGAGVCGSLLAQLGAETVLVEAPAREGFAASKWRHRPQAAAGKLSVRPDPDDPADLEMLRRLIARADVVIASPDVDGPMAAAVAEAADMDRAVVCNITAYGSDGPRAGLPDTEWQVQARAGVIETTGMADGPPVPIPLPLIEYQTGLYAAAAVVAALRVRRLSGAGQLIDVALYDCAFAAMATFLPKPLTGSDEPVRRAGNHHAMISPWNVYRAKDGWILICAGSDAQWRRLCEIMGRPDAAEGRLARIADRVRLRGEVDAIVEGWTRDRTLADCAAALGEAAIASGAVASVDPHPVDANLDHRGMLRRFTDPVSGRDLVLPGSCLRMSVTPGLAPGRIPAQDADRHRVRRLAGAPAPASVGGATAVQPLAGIRVIEIGHYTTAPLSTRHMAALGAEVIKIEPPEGEATRGWLPAQRGQGYFFTYMNSDKRSVTLDLSSEEGAASLERLLAGADVLIENLKPGALARRGFSAERLAWINPRLVYCAVTGFGHDSLYAGRPAYDSVIQAVSGIMDVVRHDGVPVKTGISSADLLGGQAALLGVLAALEHRDRTGLGQVVDISMQDVAAWATEPAWNGGKADLPLLSLVRCSDGYCLAEAGTEALRRMVGIAGADGLSAALSRRELSDMLAAAGMPAAPVLSVQEVVAAPQTRARGLFFQALADGESWPLMASPLRLSATPPQVRRPMPPLGRDNEAVLRQPAGGAPAERS